MKKLLAILLASAMMASLAACGENSDPAESTPTGSSEKEPVTITFFGGVDVYKRQVWNGESSAQPVTRLLWERL